MKENKKEIKQNRRILSNPDTPSSSSSDDESIVVRLPRIKLKRKRCIRSASSSRQVSPANSDGEHENSSTQKRKPMGKKKNLRSHQKRIHLLPLSNLNQSMLSPKNLSDNTTTNQPQINSTALETPSSNETEDELQERIQREIQATLAADKEKKQRRKSQTKPISTSSKPKKSSNPFDTQLSSSLPANFPLKSGEPSFVLQIPINLNDNTDLPLSQAESTHESTADEDKDPDYDPDNEDVFMWTEEEQEYWQTLNQVDRLEIRRKEKEVATYRKLEIPGRFHILRANMNLGSKAQIIRKIEQLDSMEPTDNEYFKLQKFVDGILRVPFGKIIPFPVSRTDPSDLVHHFLGQVATTLHKCIYGHGEAKERLLQFVAQSISNPRTNGHCIALCGPPGVGKTSLIRHGVAKALGRPFSFLALGGASDASFLEGHHYTYEGSQWGRVVDILITAKCMNPVIFFDELDKVSETKQGEEIIGVLTHLTDPTQNQVFQDKYFGGVEFDLSRCLFIFSLNDESKINTILKDRMTFIHLKGFDKTEKQLIAKEYLMPELLETVGFKPGDIEIPDETWKWMLSQHETDEAGVRSLRRMIENILLQINVIKWYPEALKYGSIADATTQNQNEKQQKAPGSELKFPFTITKEWAEYFLSKSRCEAEDMSLSAKMMYM